MVEKSVSNPIITITSNNSLQKGIAYPIIRKAIIMCAARYDGALNAYPGKMKELTPEREKNAKSMTEFLKKCHYDVIPKEQFPNPHFNFLIKTDCINVYIQEAEHAAEFNKYCSYFFYFTGYGVRINGQIYGISSKGSLIPFEYFMDRFAKCRNVLSYFYIECQFLDDLEIQASALQVVGDYMHLNQHSFSSLNKPIGISIMQCPSLRPLQLPDELLQQTDIFIEAAQSCIGKDLVKFLHAQDKSVIRVKGKNPKDWEVWCLLPTQEQRDQELNQKKENEIEQKEKQQLKPVNSPKLDQLVFENQI